MSSIAVLDAPEIEGTDPLRRDARTGPALAIVGPTASGKTALAIEVARTLDGEIISMDSRQAYRGFRVGTAAPAAAEVARAPHHGVGFLSPDERYGAGRFARLAHAWMAEIRARGRVPILAGGTGLFLRALTHPVFREPELDPIRRAALAAWADARPVEELTRWARRLDPALGGRLVTVDRQRAGRTLELALLAGRPLTWWIERGPPERPPLQPLVAVVEPPAAELRGRIRRRAEAMLEDGAWEAEVRDLIERGLEASQAFEALGYRDVAALGRREATREETLERVVSRTWTYARRQRTWLRHQVPEDAMRLDGSMATDQLARRVVGAWREAAGER